MPNVTRDDIYLDRRCAACCGELVVIPAHGLRVQHEDAECEAHHHPTLDVPTCAHCHREIHALFSPEGLVWADRGTGVASCSRDGDSGPHEVYDPTRTVLEEDRDEWKRRALQAEHALDEDEAYQESACRKLLADWFDGQLSKISEYGTSRDWPPLIDDAKARHETFGIPWTNKFVPDYVREILALEDDDDD